MARAKHADLLIIGNGAAGGSAAFAARAENPAMSILIIGKESYPEYSAPALPDYLSGELPLEKVLVRKSEEYKAKKIDVHLGDGVASVDAEKKTVTTEAGEVFTYGKLIFATGGFPIQLRRMPGTDLPGNFVLKTIDDIDGMTGYPAKRAVVVGSGAIGLEGSMALKSRGLSEVTMVEALPWLSMKSLDKRTSDELTLALNRAGVEVLADEGVSGVIGTDRVEGVITSKREISCDLILWGIGVRPEVSLAQSSGVELGETGGIKVDAYMRTNLPDVYACGDCIESTDKLTGGPALHLFWEPAQRGGELAGRHCAALLAGREPEKLHGYTGSVAVFLTHKGGLSIVAFGKTEQGLSGEGCVIEESRPGRYRRLLFEGGKLVGAQIIGTLEDVDLLLDTVEKNALVRPGTWDLTPTVPLTETTTVTDCIDYLRKERRVQPRGRRL